MARAWSQESTDLFWNDKECHLVTRHMDIATLSEKNCSCNKCLELTSNLFLVDEEKNDFVQENIDTFIEHMPGTAISNLKICNDLLFWIKNSSWTYCAFCSSVHKRKLFQGNANRPINRHQTACHCLQNRYIVPLFSLIPDCLKTLTFAEICVLRPLNFHYGDYKRMQHGYQQKNGMCHITWKDTSVEAAINTLEDDASKIRCQLTYNILMNAKERNFLQCFR